MIDADQLKNLATKDDLKGLATKEDLKQFATKEDLQATEQRFKNELWEVEQRFEEKVEDSFRKYRDDVLRGLDKVVGELQAIREEQTIIGKLYDELKARVEKLEEQVSRIISQQTP